MNYDKMKNNEQTEDRCPECGGKMDDYSACFYGHCSECELMLFVGVEAMERAGLTGGNENG